MENNQTISYDGHKLDVYYDYQPEEKEVRYYSDGSGYPGCAESIDINSVELNGRDVTKFVDLKKVEELLYELRHSYDGDY